MDDEEFELLGNIYPTKVCCTCKEEKDRSEFHKNGQHKDGLADTCKPCAKAYNKRWREANYEKYLADKAKYRERNRARTNRQAQEYRDNNKDLLKARDKEWRKNNKELKSLMDKQYREENKERVAENKKAWANANPHKRRARHARRRDQQVLATPTWGDDFKMASFYWEAQRLTKETGILHHVDHIIPILSPLVCGLHWEGNLQVLTYKENSSKHNRLLPEHSGWDSDIRNTHTADITSEELLAA